MKIDDEFIRVTNVGLGTLSIGPISGLGTFPLINGQRGYIGTLKATHANYANVKVFRGAYNIVGSEIHFTEAPTGNNVTAIDPDTLLDTARSTFGGRVYLRQDYSTNQVYDNISKSFTGIGATYVLTVAGAANSSTEQGSGIVLINNMFQTPTTTNNLGNTWTLTNNGVGSTITFSGITDDNGDLVISDYDVNKNQLPRGGMIVSLGSTGGLGVAPLHGAVVHPVIGAGKSIAEIVGIPTIGNAMGITTASYNNRTGYLEITTDVPHNFRPSNEVVTLVGLEFTCSGTYNVSDATYNAATGDLTLTIGDHELQVGEKVGIGTSSLVFQCSQR